MKREVEALSRHLLRFLGRKMVKLSKLPWHLENISEKKTELTPSPATTTGGSAYISVEASADGTKYLVICLRCGMITKHSFDCPQAVHINHVCNDFTDLS